MKQPFINLAQAQAIAEHFPTPFYIYDEAGIRRTVRAVQAAFSWAPCFREYFAVKATPNPTILRILQSEECGVDCSSETELQLAENNGFGYPNIMFSSNVTPMPEYAHAKQLGAYINFDDITHINRYRDAVGEFPEEVFCRYNPGGVFKLGNSIMDNPGEAKYGMTKDQIFQAVRQLKLYGVKRFGLHAFLASNTLGNEYYPELAAILFNLAVELHKTLGVEIFAINLSGGIGIAYRPEDQPNNIMTIGHRVRVKYDDILVANGMNDVAIFTELGRYITGPNGALVTKAIHHKDTHKHYIGVDACAANLMRPAIYGAYHHITVLGKENEAACQTYDVTGSLCENNDKFAIDRALPMIADGDYLFIHDAGAHGHAMGYNYNGKLRSAELLLRADNSVELIRRAETPADYFATLNFAPERISF